jgi:hypothetical protein
MQEPSGKNEAMFVVVVSMRIKVNHYNLIEILKFTQKYIYV